LQEGRSLGTGLGAPVINVLENLKDLEWSRLFSGQALTLIIYISHYTASDQTKNSQQKGRLCGGLFPQSIPLLPNKRLVQSAGCLNVEDPEVSGQETNQ